GRHGVQRTRPAMDTLHSSEADAATHERPHRCVPLIRMHRRQDPGEETFHHNPVETLTHSGHPATIAPASPTPARTPYTNSARRRPASQSGTRDRLCRELASITASRSMRCCATSSDSRMPLPAGCAAIDRYTLMTRPSRPDSWTNASYVLSCDTGP